MGVVGLRERGVKEKTFVASRREFTHPEERKMPCYYFKIFSSFLERERGTAVIKTKEWRERGEEKL